MLFCHQTGCKKAPKYACFCQLNLLWGTLPCRLINHLFTKSSLKMTPQERQAMINLGYNPDLLAAAAQNLGAANGGGNFTSTNTGMGILKNPFLVPQQFVMTGTIASGSTKKNFFFDDACGLASNYGSVTTDTGIAMVPTGITAANLKEYLKTYALVIDTYNFNSTDPTQLSNNLTAIYTSLDGNSNTRQLQSALSVSNMQQNQNLLNVNQSFVYTNYCALRINTSAPAADSNVYTLTFGIKGAVPYGQLDAYLEEVRIPERSKMGC